MLMANQTLLQKYARCFIYSINLNEKDALVCFSLPIRFVRRYAAEIAEKKQAELQKLKIEVHCTQQVYWSNYVWFFFPFSSSLGCNWTISSGSNARKPSKSIHQYVTMATAEPINIFLRVVWFNIFLYNHNLPQDQVGEIKFYGYHASLILLHIKPQKPDRNYGFFLVYLMQKFEQVIGWPIHWWFVC